MNWVDFKDALIEKFGKPMFDRNKPHIQQYLLDQERLKNDMTKLEQAPEPEKEFSDQGEMEFAMKLEELCEEAVLAGESSTRHVTSSSNFHFL